MDYRFTRTHALLIAAAALLVLATSVVRADFGTGWTAQYFNNPNLQGSPIITEAAPNGLNFNWGLGSPNAAIPVDNFSGRFTSTQLFNQGTYEFAVTSDDGVRVFIDNVTVLDQFVGRPLTTNRFQVSLTAGAHLLVVEYFEGIDQAALQVQWFPVTVTTPTAIGGGGGALPTPFGTPAAPTPGYTGPLATVAGVQALALRTGPYAGASYITALPGGSSYPVQARNIDEGVYNWYRIQVGERIGWASGRFLQVSVPPEQLPLAGSIFDEIAAGAPERNARAIPRAQMNIRARPSDRTNVVGEIPWGGVASLIGRTVQGGSNRWLQINYNGVIGWIDARWVTTQGEVFSVPIR
jgi:uncharacterized protein YraI